MTSPAPIQWSVIYDALHDWLAEVTGLAVDRGNQDSPQSPYPFCVFKIESGPEMEFGSDEIRYSYTPSADENDPLFNKELREDVFGFRKITVNLEVQTKPEDDDNDPDKSAMHFMSVAQASLGRTVIWQNLQAAGLAVIEEGTIVDLSSVVEDSWLSRASMDVVFRLTFKVIPDQATDGESYIEKVVVNSDFGVADSIEIKNEEIPSS